MFTKSVMIFYGAVVWWVLISCQLEHSSCLATLRIVTCITTFYLGLLVKWVWGVFDVWKHRDGVRLIKQGFLDMWSLNMGFFSGGFVWFYFFSPKSCNTFCGCVFAELLGMWASVFNLYSYLLLSGWFTLWTRLNIDTIQMWERVTCVSITVYNILLFKCYGLLSKLQANIFV